MIWFTSDTHFGHRAVIEHDNRPFKSWIDHDEALIENWNMKVSYNDTVYHLGDFAYRSERTLSYYVDALKGQIIFIRGNHDDKLMWRYNDPAKVTKHEALYLRHEGERMFLLHYPCHSWRTSNHGSWHLHGHAHGKAPLHGLRLDVGCMLWDYAPVSFDKVREILKARGPVYVNQHAD